MKKPTSKQTRQFQAKMFPRNGTTGQINRAVFIWQEPRRKGGTVSYEAKVDMEQRGAKGG